MVTDITPPYRATAKYPITADATGRTPATDFFVGSREEGAPVSQKSCESWIAHTVKGKLQRGFGLPVRVKTNPEQFIPPAEHADQAKPEQPPHERHPVPYQHLGILTRPVPICVGSAYSIIPERELRSNLA
tara:strand:- start:701 stop:1093 length:393 start_codon:yes stop_codon:yes gene_type:complete